MQAPDSPNTSFSSPKRKRDDQDTSMNGAPSPSRLKTTNLPIRPLLEDRAPSEGSPRTTVAGHLRGLALDSKLEMPRLECRKPSGIQRVTSKAGFGSGAFNSHIFHSSQTHDAPVTPPPSSDGPNSSSFKANIKYQVTSVPLEVPETPRLRPVSSPTPPPSTTEPKPPKSPPLTPSTQALWWSDTEITGHDPKDPSDDGYGINGIGFLPTPAIANARAERRKKQVAEWKNREAREARQKRSDRRRRREVDVDHSGNTFNHNENGSRADEGRRVRFLEI